LGVSIPTAAVLDPIPQLGEAWETDADPITPNYSLPGPFIDAVAPADVIPRNPSV
jgi:hypothetical protein